ncbi:MAG: hypothetical protein M0T77_04685 [Actinomycetota bacterium]|nr:hypothetical protein [Actinomycetota bacterium]
MKTRSGHGQRTKGRLDRAGKLLAAFTAACLLAGVSATVALANSYGNVTYEVTNGWHWYDQSWMQTGSTYYAWGETVHDNTGDVPDGYAGVLARAFYDNGSLCEAETSWQYISSPGYGIESPIVAPGRQCGEGNAYYSQALSRWFNGNGYDTYVDAPSPSVDT